MSGSHTDIGSACRHDRGGRRPPSPRQSDPGSPGSTARRKFQPLGRRYRAVLPDMQPTLEEFPIGTDQLTRTATTHRHRVRAPPVGQRLSPLMACLCAAPGENLAAVEALILISAPFAGLRPLAWLPVQGYGAGSPATGVRRCIGAIRLGPLEARAGRGPRTQVRSRRQGPLRCSKRVPRRHTPEH